MIKNYVSITSDNKVIENIQCSETEISKYAGEFVAVDESFSMKAGKNYTIENGIVSEHEIIDEIAEWKANRELLVSQIEVEYNGYIFQGDEKSQDRMSRALNGLPDDGVIYWKAKDNSTQELDKSDLKEILYLAGQEQTRIWFANDSLSQGE